jgi:hypothetical protein
MQIGVITKPGFLFMKLTSIKAFVEFFFFVFAAAASLRAAVIVDNLSQPTANYFGPIGSDSNKNDFLIGQEFTLPAGSNPFQLNGITLLLTATGGGANITVSIRGADTNNNPSIEVAVLASQLVTNAGAVTFSPSTNIILSPGIYYVVAAPTSPGDSGRVSWAYANTTNWIGSGMLDSLADTIPGNWENFTITNLPQQMRLQATPIPARIGISMQGSVTTLSWPSVLNGYVVDGATNLSPALWQALTNPVGTGTGTNTLTNHWTATPHFFRLRQSLVAENLDQPGAGWDGPIGSDNNMNDFLLAQQFSLPTGNYALNKLTLTLIPANGSGNVTVSIWSVGSDGNPASQLAVVSSQLVSSAGNVDFLPATPITLTAGSYYVVAAPTTSADNGKVGWYYTISTAWTGFGALANYASTFYGIWENEPISLGPYQLSIQATPANP